MFIYTDVSVDTSLTYSKSKLTINDEAEYLNHLSGEIQTRNIPNKKITYHFDEFGDVDFILTVSIRYNLFENYKDKYIIPISIRSSDVEFDGKEWDFISIFDNNYSFKSFILAALNNYVNEINEAIKDVKHLVWAEMAYTNGDIFIKVSPFDTEVMPEWTSLHIDQVYDMDEIEFFSSAV